MKPLIYSLLFAITFTNAQADTCTQQGRELLFSRDLTVMTRHGSDFFTEAYRIDASGNNETAISKGAFSRPRFDTTDAAWLPDGMGIVFAGNKDTNTTEIYRMGINGRDMQRLTNNSTDDEYPAWSSKGEVLFSSNRDGGDFQLYRMNTAGQQQHRLTKNKEKDFDVRWDAKGESYVFTRERGQHERIYFGKGDSAPVPLTPAWMNAAEPDITGDGKHIIFVSDGHRPGSGNRELYIMRSEDLNRDGIGDQLYRLTKMPEYTASYDPDISADGKCIVFVREVFNKPGGPAVYVASLDKPNEAVQLVEGFAPRWRPGRATH